jgi:DNA-binding XRE family transcriptional regulator
MRAIDSSPHEGNFQNFYRRAFVMPRWGGWPASRFGSRLKELREERGLTQKQLAELAGCHQRTITKLELEAQEPAWPLVLALCKALGVSCEAFTVPPADRPSAGPGRPAKADHANKPAATPKRGRGRPRKDEG